MHTLELSSSQKWAPESSNLIHRYIQGQRAQLGPCRSRCLDTIVEGLSSMELNPSQRFWWCACQPEPVCVCVVLDGNGRKCELRLVKLPLSYSTLLEAVQMLSKRKWIRKRKNAKKEATTPSIQCQISSPKQTNSQDLMYPRILCEEFKGRETERKEKKRRRRIQPQEYHFSFLVCKIIYI